MNISRRQLYAFGEPLGDSATRTKPGGRIYGGGSGGGNTSTGTTYTSNIPEYASGPFMSLVGRADALSSQPYQPYTGARIQGFTPLQQNAQALAGAQTVAPQITGASNLVGSAATSSFTTPGTVSAYMSPYMQNVVDIQKREAMRDAGIAGTQRDAQFVKAGAFGGSRQAIMNAEADRNLSTQLGDIQAKGLQAAYESGQGQFNNEMNRGLAGATALGDLGQKQFGQQMDITNLRNTMGGQQQALGQKAMDQQYADFQQQRDYPYQQLGFLSDILRGVSGSTRTMYSSAPQASGLQTIAGLGTAAAGLFKGGGLVAAYAAGGAVDPRQTTDMLSQLPDAELQRYTQLHKDDPFAAALAVSESKRRATLRQAGQGQPPAPSQPTVLEQSMSQGLGAAVPGPAMAMADGGIVGYAEGGPTPYAPYGPSINSWKRNLADARTEHGTAPADPLAEANEAAMRMRGYGLTPEEQTRLKQQLAADAQQRAQGEAAGRAGLVYVPGAVPEERMQGEVVEDERLMADERRKRAQSGLGAVAAGPATIAPEPAARTGGGGGGGLAAAVSSRRGGASAPGSAVPSLGIDGVLAEGERRLQAIGDSERAAAQEDLSAFDKDVAARGVLGADREKRLKDQEAGLAGKKDDARRMALVEAGLSILSADPSRGAFSAIGEGALKGVRAYKGDVKELEAQREQILDKMDTLSDLRRQESIATGTERRGLTREIRKIESQTKRDMYGLFKDVGVPMKMKEVEMAFQAQQKALDRSTTLQAASISASGGGNKQLELINALERNPALLRTYQAMNGSKAKPENLMSDYTDWLKANPTAAMAPPDQSLKDFLKAQAVFKTVGQRGAVTSTPGATVLSR